jgi:hypothetical protein
LCRVFSFFSLKIFEISTKYFDEIRALKFLPFLVQGSILIYIIIYIIMARKFSQRHIRKITRTGTSLTVSLPVDMLALLKWKEKQKVVVKKIRGGVSIKDWKR